MIIMLAKALECSADYLLGLEYDDFLETGFKQIDRISFHDFVDVIKALNERQRLDFYIDKDKNIVHNIVQGLSGEINIVAQTLECRIVSIGRRMSRKETGAVRKKV